MYARVSPHLPLAETQHGFRPGRSTSTALLPLFQLVVAGFNQRCPPRRTVAMAVDFSKAFDTINHTALLRSLPDTDVPSKDIRWLFTYLRGRTASCSYNRQDSAKVILHQGVPQGSILSPLLFNFMSPPIQTPQNCALATQMILPLAPPTLLKIELLPPWQNTRVTLLAGHRREASLPRLKNRL